MLYLIRVASDKPDLSKRKFHRMIFPRLGFSLPLDGAKFRAGYYTASRFKQA